MGVVLNDFNVNGEEYAYYRYYYGYGHGARYYGDESEPNIPEPRSDAHDS
jgi:hypothetical protein